MLSNIFLVFDILGIRFRILIGYLNNLMLVQAGGHRVLILTCRLTLLSAYFLLFVMHTVYAAITEHISIVMWNEGISNIRNSEFWCFVSVCCWERVGAESWVMKHMKNKLIGYILFEQYHCIPNVMIYISYRWNNSRMKSLWKFQELS